MSTVIDELLSRARIEILETRIRSYEDKERLAHGPARPPEIPPTPIRCSISSPPGTWNLEVKADTSTAFEKN